jgi:hypothetical protein
MLWHFSVWILNVGSMVGAGKWRYRSCYCIIPFRGQSKWKHCHWWVILQSDAICRTKWFSHYTHAAIPILFLFIFWIPLPITFICYLIFWIGLFIFSSSSVIISTNYFVVSSLPFQLCFIILFHSLYILWSNTPQLINKFLELMDR